MGRKLDKSLIKESKEELEQLLKKEKDVRVYKRLRVIYLIKTMDNPKLQDIAQIVGIVKKTAFEYWDWYKKGGIDNLKLKYKGRIPRLNEEDIDKLKEKAKEGFDSLKSIQEWIKEELQKELSIKTVSYWCKKLGIKKKGQTFKYK
jgi:transposase